MKRGKLKAMAEGPLKELTERAETLKARLRSRVEWFSSKRDWPPDLGFLR
jgi:hypothetical protein